MLRLRTLGGLSVDQVSADDGAAARRRPLALLALLAVAGPRGLSRDKIVGYLWPESGDERARNSLSQVLTTLKREFGVDQLVQGSSELRLNAELISSDIQEFNHLLDGGATERAVGLYGGPFLDGVFLKGALEFERWVERERQRLHRLYLAALDRLADDASVAADHVAVVRWRRERASAEPLDSRAAFSLMQALVNSGDSAGALQHFRRHAEQLHNELGIQPEPEVSDFAASLRAGSGPRPSRALDANALVVDQVRAAAGTATRPNVAGPPVIANSPTALRGSRWWVFFGGALAVLLLVAMIAFRDRTDLPLVVGNIETLTRSPDTLDVDASISPNGQYVAYAAGSQGRFKLYLRQVSQSAAVPVAPGVAGNQRWPRWSPDGASIVFSSGNKIYETPSISGPTRLLVDGGAYPSFSPDGKQLAYSRADTIWIVPRDSGKAVPIDTAHQANSPAWSPDGRRIAYVRGTMQYAAGGISPGSIRIVDVDGKNRRQITTEEHLNTAPVWEPGGRAILFVSDRDGTRDVYRQLIDARGEPQGAPGRVGVGADIYNFTLSRDGSRIAWSTWRQSKQIWTAPITSGLTPFDSARAVTTEAQRIEGVAISHDGKWLAFDSDRDGPRQHLFKVAFDGKHAVGEPIQLTRGSGNEFAPRWSPDDSEIVFHRNLNGYRNVFVVGSDGRGEQRVTNDTSQYYDPDWSPDGRHIVLSDHRTPGGGPASFNAVIVSRGADDSWSGHRIVNDSATRAGAIVRWSPKGDQLLMSGSVVLPVDGGATRSIVKTNGRDGRGDFVVWGPDARTVYVHSNDSGVRTIWGIDLATRNPRRILRMDDPSKPPFLNRFDTDGKRLFFIISADDSDVFAATLTHGVVAKTP